MGDQIARAKDYEVKAEKKMSGWGLFGSKFEDAAELYDKAANCYKLAKSWDKAGENYSKLANCYLKVDSKHEASQAYVDASRCYKKTSNNAVAISYLEKAVNMMLDNGKLNMAARYYKDIADLYESEQNIEQAIIFNEKAADMFESEDNSTSSANQCKQKVAQFSAQLMQYQRSIEIYENIAKQSMNSSLLKYGVKGHILNAGLCYLCEGDVVAITNALERFQELDPAFAGTREYKLLADIAAAIDEEDVAKFTDVVKEFDSMTPLDAWKTTLLLRIKEKLKLKEMQEDDLS